MYYVYKNIYFTKLVEKEFGKGPQVEVPQSDPGHQRQ